VCSGVLDVDLELLALLLGSQLPFAAQLLHKAAFDVSADGGSPWRFMNVKSSTNRNIMGIYPLVN
jgi:hypothetical protein